MKISDLNMDKRIINILEQEGITELYPHQTEAINHILNNQNVMIAVPTASGKSLPGYLTAIKCALEGMKAVYIVPLKALAMEKYEDLKKFEKLGISVGLFIGDYDSSYSIEYYDIVIATCEKMDSLLRHDASIAQLLGAVVIDEIHLMHDKKRGPTLEMVITKLNVLNPDIQLIGLSATVNNSIEIAGWLNAKHVYSEWRVVKLREGVYQGGEIKFLDGKTVKIQEDVTKIGNLIKKSVKNNGQCLVFVNSRRNAESLAKRLGIGIKNLLTEEEKNALANLKIDDEDIYAKKVLMDMKSGCAFHHAGLSPKQRKLIEDMFKKRILKVIVATPTLAAGINLPARTVIIKDTKRFDGFYSQLIPIMEIKQMLGRAGRPKYDEYGEGIIYAGSEEYAEKMLCVLEAESEDVESKLNDENILRMHILGLIASGIVGKREDVIDFIEKTFFGYTIEEDLEYKIDDIIDFLRDNEFIQKKNMKATKFGKRCSELYIDPITALMFKNSLEKKWNIFGVLQMISSVPDMFVIRVSSKEMNDLVLRSIEYQDDIMIEVDKEHLFFDTLKTALMFMDWIDEHGMDDILEKYKIGPGDLHTRIQLADWLLYSYREIRRLFNATNVKDMDDLRIRMKYGVKKDIVSLTLIRDVGRIRARRLYNRRYTIEKLKQAKAEHLAKIPGIGDALAKNIIEFVKTMDDY